jgi:hypothetical protein
MATFTSQLLDRDLNGGTFKSRKERVKMITLAWYWWASIAALIGYLVYSLWFK